jgi:hypothetical protein
MRFAKMMQRCFAFGRWAAADTLLAALLLAGCDPGTLVDNRLPNTHLALDTIALQGDNRLNSVVRMSWYGTDVDGYVDRYEVSLDGTSWKTTRKQDSTFTLSIPAGQDTADVVLRVRAVDDDGGTDPTPARLRLPLKNARPVASIDPEGQTLGTTLGVATYKWRASDPDGDETVVAAEARFNNGTWFPIPVNQPVITFVVEPGSTATATARMVYGNNNSLETTAVDGLEIDENNTLYIRVKDVANRWSDADTALPVVFTRPSGDLLVVSGSPSTTANTYLSALAGSALDIDFWDMNVAANLPAYWNPTFRWIAQQYSKVFVFSGPTPVLDPSTGQTSTLLGLMGPALQKYTQNGGKLLITTALNSTMDLTPYIGTYPIDGMVTSVGQVRLVQDSALLPLVPNYPPLKPESILIGLTPIQPSADAQPFYRAQLTKLSGWSGTNVVGVRRFAPGPGNRVQQVFFSVELFKANAVPGALSSLLQSILVNDFNW